MNPNKLLHNETLVAEINFELNDLGFLGTLSESSSHKVWWRCRTDPRHTWSASPRNRLIDGYGCAICSGKQAQRGINDFATLFPELLDEWDFDANEGVSPDEIRPGSTRIVGWVCSKDARHRWRTSLNLRTRTNPGPTGCPTCQGKKIQSGINDLGTLHPELLSEWCFDKNIGVDPYSISPGSRLKVTWKCALGHYWEASISKRTIGRGCHICANQTASIGVNDFGSQHPELITFWDFTANEIRPDQIVSKSNRRLKWICDLGHSFVASAASIVNGQGCPYCANVSLLVGFNDLASRHPEICSWWDFSRNQDVTPQDVLGASSKTYWWVCDKKHSFSQSPNERLKRGCPVCANYQIIVGVNDLATADPRLASEWDYAKNGLLTPEQVVPGSHRRIWWTCELRHSWQATVVSRATRNKTGCPTCAVSGFRASAPSILYFIQNPQFGARKIGITNGLLNSGRLEHFSAKGWVFISKFYLSSGEIARRAEREVLNWIRLDLDIPQFLGQKEMGRRGGATETFGMDGPTNEEVIARMKLAITSAPED